MVKKSFYAAAVDIGLFIKGIFIGFALALPVGPVGLLCVRRVLAYGPIAGIFSGLGAAFADALYGLIAGYGLSYLSTLLFDNSQTVQFIGGIVLCLAGIRTYYKIPEPLGEPQGMVHHIKGNVGRFFSTFFLTIANPLSIIAFTGVFAGLGALGTPTAPAEVPILVLGIFTGSALWWLSLTLISSFFRKHMDDKSQRRLNRISGILIGAFGVLALALLVFEQTNLSLLLNESLRHAGITGS